MMGHSPGNKRVSRLFPVITDGATGCSLLESNPLGRRFLHGATSRILLSWAILFDAATLLSVFGPGEKNDDDIE